MGKKIRCQNILYGVFSFFHENIYYIPASLVRKLKVSLYIGIQRTNIDDEYRIFRLKFADVYWPAVARRYILCGLVVAG